MVVGSRVKILRLPVGVDKLVWEYYHGLEKDVSLQIERLVSPSIHVRIAHTDYSVGSIKSKIKGLTGLPVKQQKLIMQGRELENHRPMSFYRVTSSTKLYLLIRRIGKARTYKQFKRDKSD